MRPSERAPALATLGLEARRVVPPAGPAGEATPRMTVLSRTARSVWQRALAERVLGGEQWAEDVSRPALNTTLLLPGTFRMRLRRNGCTVAAAGLERLGGLWSQMVAATPSFSLEWRCAMRVRSARGNTWAQRDELWVRHLADESRHSIARQLGKLPGSIHDIIWSAGGIAPRKRSRSDQALSLTEREVIERALARGASHMPAKVLSSISPFVKRR